MARTENAQTAVRFTQLGPVESHLTVTSIPKPSPPPGHSLIQIRAAAINPSDVGSVEGRFPLTTVPRTPGRDFAGVVVEGPAEYIGRRVWGTGGTNGFDRDGAHAEWITVASDALADMDIPGSLTFEQAAACGVGFLTASLMLDRANVGEGDYVLVLGSSGAVGSSAVQLARYRGAIPVLTSRKGDQGVVSITAESLTPQIEEVTKGKGVAAVIDTVGEAGLFKKSVAALGDNGRYVIISASKAPGFQFTFDALEFYRGNKSMHGLNTIPVSFGEAARVLGSLKRGFEEGVLIPPAALEEVDLADEQAVVTAYLKVKSGSKAKQILVNRNV